MVRQMRDKTIISVMCLSIVCIFMSFEAFADTTLYDFESGVQGWIPQTYIDSQACTSVAQSAAQKQQGSYSLIMNMDLVGGDANKSKGESFVDRGDVDLIDLNGVPFNIYVYCPTGSDGGNPSNANGMQIFFKDNTWKSWYGPWQSIGNSLTWYDILMGSWNELAVTLGTTAPSYMDSGFDYSNIRIIGIKMATGSGSTSTYAGPVYLDYAHTVGADTTPPAPPSSISVSDPGTGGTLNIFWTNPTDPDFNHVHIYRSTSSGTLGSLIADNQTGTTYQNTGLTNGTVYYYTLRSVDTTGNESTNTDQYSAAPSASGGDGTTFYDFEDGTVQGWSLQGATGLSNSTTRAHSGSRSIKFNVPTSIGLLGLGGTGYVVAESDESPFPYLDLNPYDTVSAWIYLEPGISIPGDSPIDALMTMNTQTGFYRGDSTAIQISNASVGMWHKLTYDLIADTYTNKYRTTRIAVRLEGGGGMSGSADLYIDFVRGNGNVTPPGPPTGISAVDATTGQRINLVWTNPGDADFAHIHIYRSTTSGVLGSLVHDNVPGTSFADTGLTDYQMYYYTVRSADTGGNESTNTTQYSAAPTGNDTTPPGLPFNIDIFDPATGGTLDHVWTNPSDVDFNHIHIYRSTQGGVTGPLIADNITGNTYQDTGLTNGQLYYYSYQSVDDVGNASGYTSQYSQTPTGGDTTPPAPPSNINVVDPQTGGQLNLSWTNPGDADFNHVHIYRSTSSGVLGALVHDNVTGTSKSDTGLVNGQIYYYTLRSVDDSNNESTNTDQNSGTPTIVSSGMLYDFEDGTTQSWTNDTTAFYEDNLGTPSNSTSRAHDGSRSLVYPLDLTDKDTTSGGINDVGRIQPAVALNLSTEAGMTMYAYIPADIQVPPEYPLQAQLYIKTGVSWTWYNGNTQNMVKGHWTRLTIDFSSAEYPAGPVANINSIREVGIHVFGAAPGKGGTTIYVDSVEAGLGSDQSAPNAPSGLFANDAASGNQINLSWSHNSEGDLAYYKIYRSHSSGSLGSKKFITIVNTGTNSYNDTSVVNGINYYYQLTAVDTSSNESGSSGEDSVQPSGGAELDFNMKGVQYTTWETDYYSSSDSEASLDDLKSTGANYVGVLVTWYMDNKNSNTIYSEPTKTPTDASVIDAINDIHARGMNVMLKPHIDCMNGDWRGYIDPSDVSGWFTEYSNFITHFAQIAENNGVELFSIGCEFKNMSQVKYLSYWNTVISNVRTAYAGPIVYAANSSGEKDEISTVGFWDQMDYAGLDIYLPLTDSSSPSVDDLKRAWTSNKDGNNWVQNITDWQAYINKPVIITEIGYQSASGTNITPWWVDSPTVDLSEQQDCYEVAFQVWNNKSWMQGWFTWDWSPWQNAGGPFDTGFTPQNKPALDTLTTWYGGEQIRPFYDFEDATTQGWVNDTSGDYIDNLGTPVNSTAYSKTGSRSIAYPLNLDNKTDGAINDAGYVSPIPAKDLSGYTGIKMYVYIPAGANIDPGTPLGATVYVKTGGQRDYFESNSVQAVFPGVAREINLDFSSAKDGAGQPDQTVTNTQKIREIGIHIGGAETSSGMTTIYIDTVAAGGEGDILGISLSPDAYTFPAIEPGTSFIAAVQIIIENSGNVTSNYYIQCANSDPKGWTPSNTSPALHEFVLNAQFNSVQPVGFVEANHALITSPVLSSVSKFAGDQTGINVAPDGVRDLWFEFNAPLVDSGDDYLIQTIPVVITTEMAP
ncbi:MAG: hypothetical protein ABH868_05315 [bacterium]